MMVLCKIHSFIRTCCVPSLCPFSHWITWLSKGFLSECFSCSIPNSLARQLSLFLHIDVRVTTQTIGNKCALRKWIYRCDGHRCRFLLHPAKPRPSRRNTKFKARPNREHQPDNLEFLEILKLNCFSFCLYRNEISMDRRLGLSCSASIRLKLDLKYLSFIIFNRINLFAGLILLHKVYTVA